MYWSIDLLIHRSTYRSIYWSIDPLIHRSTHPSIYLSIDLLIHRSTDPSIYWSRTPPIHWSTDALIYQSISLPIHRSADASIYLSIYRSTDWCKCWHSHVPVSWRQLWGFYTEDVPNLRWFVCLRKKSRLFCRLCVFASLKYILLSLVSLLENF